MRNSWTLIALVVMALLAGCQGKGTTAAPSDKVTLAIATNPDSALAHVAAARGFFRDEGLAATIHVHQYGKPALQEVLDGKADFATVAETPVMFAILEGKKIAVVSTIMTSSLSHAILARRDRGIANLNDLKGKKIGTSLGTSAEFYLHSVLVINGLSPADYRIVNLPANRLPEALARGDIDAASAFLPYSALIQKRLGSECVVFRDKDIYRESFTVVAGKEFVEKRPETVSKLLKALIRAEVFVKEHPEQAQKIVAEYAGLDNDIVRTLWAETSMSTSLDQTLMLSLEEEARWAMKHGLTRAREAPNFLDFIYLEGLRSLKPEAVRILK